MVRHIARNAGEHRDLGNKKVTGRQESGDTEEHSQQGTLASDGNAFIANWNPVNRKFNVNGHDRSNSNPSNGPRQKFQHDNSATLRSFV